MLLPSFYRACGIWLQIKCRIFLGYTSNMISCGLRETFRDLAKYKMVRIDCAARLHCSPASCPDEDTSYCSRSLVLQAVSFIKLLIARHSLNAASHSY